MTKSAVLKRVKEAFPEAFKALPKTKLKLIENAIVYATKMTEDEILTPAEHKEFLIKLTGSETLSAGQTLRAYRNRQELTQAQLAKKAGIPQANISAMEAGNRAIGILTAKKLAKALNCNYKRLI